VGSDGEIEQAVFVGRVEFFEAGLENEMIEEFLHGKDSSSAVDQGFHFEEPELVESVSPNVHSVFVGNEQFFLTFIERGG
jgi:hypothetical protein